MRSFKLAFFFEADPFLCWHKFSEVLEVSKSAVDIWCTVALGLQYDPIGPIMFERADDGNTISNFHNRSPPLKQKKITLKFSESFTSCDIHFF